MFSCSLTSLSCVMVKAPKATRASAGKSSKSSGVVPQQSPTSHWDGIIKFLDSLLTHLRENHVSIAFSFLCQVICRFWHCFMGSMLYVFSCMHSKYDFSSPCSYSCTSKFRASYIPKGSSNFHMLFYFMFPIMFNFHEEVSFGVVLLFFSFFHVLYQLSYNLGDAWFYCYINVYWLLLCRLPFLHHSQKGRL